MGKTRKRRKGRKKKVYTRKQYNSGEGMLTSVWGPGLWFFLHTISFNYPNKPTAEQKKHYKNFILQLKYILPCRYCRENLKKNLKALPLREMLGKKSGLTYANVRERHEHFRSRCTKKDKREKKRICKTKKEKEKGCTTPLYGKKAKCVIKIVPQETKCSTFQMDKKCVKERK